MIANLLNKLQTQIELMGLDIGTASVKLVRLLKDSSGYTVSLAVREDIEGDAPDDKERLANTVAAVKRCFDKASGGRNVVCGIQGSQVIVRGFKFPPLPNEAVEQAVRFEASQVCPFESKNSVLDYQLIECPNLPSEEKASKATHRNGLMVVSTDEAIREIQNVVTHAGGSTLMVDASALAILNCLNELGLCNTLGTVAVIDLGWTYTNVIIYGQDGLPFVRDLGNAGQAVVKAISTELGVSVDEIHQTLSGKETPTEIRNQILLAMNNAIRPMAVAINETLRFYSFQEKGAAIEKIYLCGGFSLIDTFVEFLSDALSVDVELLNPFEKMNSQVGTKENELLKTCGPVWTVAAGLAMRTI